MAHPNDHGHSTSERIFRVPNPEYRENNSTPHSGAQNSHGSSLRHGRNTLDRGLPIESIHRSFNSTENKLKNEEHNFWRSSTMNSAHQRNGAYSNQARNYASSYQTEFQMSYAEQDIEQYRNGYPGKEDDEAMHDNILFYSNILGAQPERITIDEIHRKWWGNYDLLERNHTYIQWLFPIREEGMNSSAQVLQLHEANRIREDHEMSNRFVKSYGMMLDFYGMKLVEEQPSTAQQSRRFMKLRYTGEIELNRDWKQRFDNLNRSAHNNLRITRILKSLGEMGFDEYQFWFVYFILQQIFNHHRLQNCWTSCKDYWVPLPRSREKRDRLKKYIKDMCSGRMH